MERFAVKKLLPRILKVTKIGSIIGKRIYYNGVEVLKGQRHTLSKG